MLLKSADDKTKRISFLENLQQTPHLNKPQKDWLRDELHRTKRGIAGERDAAHYLNNYLKDDPDRAILHDLRFVVDGDVVQIDHLIISRGMQIYLLETKNFAGNLHINGFGEFSVEYSGERVIGIPSPLEQSKRHEGPLKKLFDLLEISGRMGKQCQFHHCVLVQPASLIHRPDPERFDTSNVMKTDAFRAWHERFMDRSMGVGAVLGTLLTMRGADTVREFGEKLMRQHRPANLLSLPELMKPPMQTATSAPSVREAAPRAVYATSTPSDSESTLRTTEKPTPTAKAPAPLPSTAPTHAPKATPRTLQCATCGSKITYAEGKFCWNNERRFGGLQYCREHQASFT